MTNIAIDETNRKLVCPNCESRDLATSETIQGSVACEIRASDHHIDGCGRTEVYWDTSTTNGIFCRECGWNAEGTEEEWMKELLLEPIQCDNCGETLNFPPCDESTLVHTESGSVYCDPKDPEWKAEPRKFDG